MLWQTSQGIAFKALSVCCLKIEPVSPKFSKFSLRHPYKLCSECRLRFENLADPQIQAHSSTLRFSTRLHMLVCACLPLLHAVLLLLTSSAEVLRDRRIMMLMRICVCIHAGLHTGIHLVSCRGVRLSSTRTDDSTHL